MGQTIVWAEAAARELMEVADRIAQDSPAYAAAFVDRVLSIAESLAEFPLQGHRVEESPRLSLREVPIRGYRLIYKVSAKQVTVVMFLHEARELPPIEKSRLDHST